MSDKPRSSEKQNQQLYYEIRLKGYLDSQWTDWFDQMTITLEEDGNSLLTGTVVDQAALHGLLKKIRDLGLTLISICPGQPDKLTSSDLK